MNETGIEIETEIGIGIEIEIETVATERRGKDERGILKTEIEIGTETWTETEIDEIEIYATRTKIENPQAATDYMNGQIRTQKHPNQPTVEL